MAQTPRERNETKQEKPKTCRGFSNTTTNVNALPPPFSQRLHEKVLFSLSFVYFSLVGVLYQARFAATRTSEKGRHEATTKGFFCCREKEKIKAYTKEEMGKRESERSQREKKEETKQVKAKYGKKGEGKRM